MEERMNDKVLLAHGSGGRLSHDLIEKYFMPRLDNPILNRLDDSAVLEMKGRIAFTTDSYIIKPVFFPGGDIGRLAVCGTINDLSTSGAVPKYLSLGLIIEEGLPIADLEDIMASVSETAKEAGVFVVTGDTKVVDHGSADGIFINTSGIGIIPEDIDISGANAKDGDKVIISGTIGDHGITVMAQREGLKFTVPVESDCAPLNGLVSDILKVSANIHCLRDPTRGGLATTLIELASQSGVGIQIYEDKIPVRDAVRGMCEILGFDPLYIANEGKMVIIAGPEDADIIIDILRKNRYGGDAAVIGEVTSQQKGRVVLKTGLGSSRIVDMPAGDLLPRIC
ncbi:MAG: hydrogenase expression/formation protein HypE [Deltaproteobacteria bacterium]|nr:hydrogenase expression/formation protein HypE [Deltaproteobacteria bacterium]